MASAFLIYNTRAARWSPRRLDVIKRTLEEGGYTVQAWETAYPGHAVELGQQAVEQQVSMVVVFGGDGTIMQASMALIGSDIPLAIIPGGTGNLLSINVGVPRNIRRAARIAVGNTLRSIDSCRRTGDEPQVFSVGGGAGFDARLMAATRGNSKRRWGQLAYVLQSLKSMFDMPRYTFTLTVDGDVHHVTGIAIMVVNCGVMIPRLIDLGAEVRPDDGILNVIVFDAKNVLDVVLVMLSLVFRRTNRFLRRHAGERIRIEADQPVGVELDGDLAGHTPLEVAVQPGALRIKVPG